MMGLLQCGGKCTRKSSRDYDGIEVVPSAIGSRIYFQEPQVDKGNYELESVRIEKWDMAARNDKRINTFGARETGA